MDGSESKQKNIFISYARRDSTELAQRLCNDLLTEGYSVWLDTREIEGGDNWSIEIENAIDNCNVTLALISEASISSNNCREEWRRTRRKHKRLIPLLVQQGIDYPLQTELLHYRDFSRTSDYSISFGQLLEDLKNLPRVTSDNNDFSAAKPFSHTLPSLPPDFVQRPLELTRIRNLILSANTKTQVSITALYGMGGIGKSVLAAVICRDQVIQDAFPQGIFWITVGRVEPHDGEALEQFRQRENAFLVQKQIELSKCLGGHVRIETVEQGVSYLRVLLQNKACLIVLDDVWESTHLQAFDIGQPLCRILVTSRKATIGKGSNTTSYMLGVLSDEQALELLSETSGQKTLPPEAIEITRILGNLPFCLTHIGRIVRHKSERWAVLLEKLRMSSIDDCFSHIMQTSLGYLPLPYHERYLDLAVFSEDEPIPEVALMRIWKRKGLDSEEVINIINSFEDLSLLQDDAVGWRLHDLQFEYLQSKTQFQRTTLHRELLTAYKPDDNAHWSTIKDDGYILDHLLYHLEQAQLKEEIHKLFNDDRWVSVRRGAKILRDFDRAKAIVDEIDLITRIRYCFYTDALRKRYPQIMVEALLELIKRGLLGEGSAESLATAIQGTKGDNEAKVGAYLDTLKQLPSGMHQRFALEALRLVHHISEPEKRAASIGKLLDYVSDENAKRQWFPLFWRTVLDIREWQLRDPLLQYLLSQPLTQEQWTVLLNDVFTLLDSWRSDLGVRDPKPYRCIYVLEVILPAYSEAIRDKAWRRLVESIMKEYSNPYSRGELFASLAKRLPKHLQSEYGDLIWQILKACPHWEGAQEGDFVPAIYSPLLPFVPTSYLMRVWERTKQEDDYWRDLMRAELIPYMPTHLQKLILNEVPFDATYLREEWLEPLLMLVPLCEEKKQSQFYNQIWLHILENHRLHQTDLDDWLAKLIPYFPLNVILDFWQATMVQMQQSHLDNKERKNLEFGIYALVGKTPAHFNEAFFSFLLKHYQDYPRYGAKIARRIFIQSTPERRLELWKALLEQARDKEAKEYQVLVISLYFTLDSLVRRAHTTDVLLFIKNIVDDEHRIRLICNYISDSSENNSLLWLQAFAQCLTGNFWWFHSLIALLPQIFGKFSQHERELLSRTDWNSPTWDIQLNSYGGIEIFEGLSILVLHASPEFARKLTVKYANSEQVFSILGFALAVHFTGQEQEALIARTVEYQYSKNDNVLRLLNLLPSEVIWDIWVALSNTYKTTGRGYAYERMVTSLIPHLPQDKLLEATNMILRKEGPSDFPDDFLPHLAQAISSPETALILWNNISKYEEIYHEYQLYNHQRSKALLVSHLPNEVLLEMLSVSSIADEPSNTELPNIFTYRLDKYLRAYVWTWDQEEMYSHWPLPKYKTDEIEDKLVHAILFPGSVFSYISFPIIFTMQLLKKGILVMLGVILRCLLVDKLASRYFPEAVFERVPFREYIEVLFMPVSLLIHFIFPREFQKLVQLHTLPQSNVWARVDNMLCQEASPGEFARVRPLLQRLGGKRLRRSVAAAYVDSVSWWKEAVRRI
jgi:hypothetical protein